MQIRCKKCGTKYYVKDELITEKGIKVRCSKCGTTFILKKKRSEPKPSEEKPTEQEVNLDKYLELTKEASFLEELKHSGLTVKMILLALTICVATLIFYSAVRYLKIKTLEKTVYAAVALKYGYTAEAIKELEELIQKDPDNLAYNYLLAKAYYLLDDPKATQYFKNAAKKIEDPGLRGSLLVRAGDINEGIALLQTALITANDTAAVSNDLGVAYLLTGNKDRGFSYLEDAYNSYPFEALFNKTLFGLKNPFEESSKLIEKLYARYPTRVEVLINTAVFFAKRKITIRLCSCCCLQKVNTSSLL